MNITKENIVTLVLIIIIVWLIYNYTIRESFDVIQDRWAYPLLNLAGDAWTKDQARAMYYSNPDGIMTGIPIPPTNDAQTPYARKIYRGTFEIPHANPYGFPIPDNGSGVRGMDDDDNYVISNPAYAGCSYEKMPRSPYQSEDRSLPRALQLQMGESQQGVISEIEMQMRPGYSQPEYEVQEEIENMEPVLSEDKNIYISGSTENYGSLFMIIVVVVLVYYYFYVRNE